MAAFKAVFRREMVILHSAAVHGNESKNCVIHKGVMEMRNLILGAGLILSGLFAPTANAMPMSAIPHGKAPLVQQADYACGRGFHLSPRGYCRPNGPPRGYYDRWDRRDRWEARREWRERQERRAWRERRDWDRGYDYREYRWQ